MSAAFDRAWAVLKQDILDVRTRTHDDPAGVFRWVIPHPNDPNQMVKIPTEDIGLLPEEVAIGHALSQMEGYNVTPEIPILTRDAYSRENNDWNNDGLMPSTMQERATALTGDARHQKPTPNLHDFLGIDLSPLGGALGLSDIHQGNVRQDSQGNKTIIDFQASLPHPYPHHGNAFSHHMQNWGKVPSEQREQFMAALPDNSIFDPWRSIEAMDALYSHYLAQKRALQNIHATWNDPHQTKLTEYGGGMKPGDYIEPEPYRSVALEGYTGDNP